MGCCFRERSQVSHLFYSPIPVATVERAMSPGMISTASAPTTSQGPPVPSSDGAPGSRAYRLPPVRRFQMALCVSLCPGCWVLKMVRDLLGFMGCWAVD